MLMINIIYIGNLFLGLVQSEVLHHLMTTLITKYIENNLG